MQKSSTSLPSSDRRSLPAALTIHDHELAPYKSPWPRNNRCAKSSVADVQDALATLPDDACTAIVTHDYLGFSFSDVARILLLPNEQAAIELYAEGMRQLSVAVGVEKSFSQSLAWN